MNDARLWEEMQRGAPVEHCRAKIEADRIAAKAIENRRALKQAERRPIPSLRCAA